MSERNVNEDKFTVPSWKGLTGIPEEGATEDWCLEWRERHSLAYLELAEMCGLAEPVPENPRYWRETDHSTRTEGRTDAVFESLKLLVEIDPDGRR